MGKKFRKILATVLSISMLATFCAVPMTASAESTDLKFGQDGKFKIVVFADVQESDKDPNGIARLQDMMTKAINRENPDIVVFAGDQTEINIKDVQGDFKDLLEQILAPVVDANVPYAFVFGNHDFQSNYSGQRTDKDAMLAVYQSIGDCRVVDADPSLTGTGTCKIPVYSSDGNSVAVDLFMVDSNTYQEPITGAGGYDNPHADQLAWIAANRDEGAKSIMFQHIPMPEVYNLVKEDASGEKPYGGKTYAKELNDGVSGALGEFPCPCNYENNTGEFAALKEMGDVLGVVTGHDHLNDYSGTYDGITMTAVPGMTYFSYGNENVRGYGVIELDENDLSSYEYHSVKFPTLDSEAIPYAIDVDFSGGVSIDRSGLTTPIANSGSSVKYVFDETLNKTVAQFDGSSGFGYVLSNEAKKKMQNGYTYEILYKLPSVPEGETDLASGMYSGGFGTEWVNDRTEIDYWQSFEGDTSGGQEKPYRQIYYKAGSKATNEWIHLVAVWDPDARDGAGQLIGYLNGNSEMVDFANPSTKELKFNANGEFYIGGNSATNGTFRDGTTCDIAFVRIHDKVYSSSEIPALYEEATTPGEGFVDGKYYQYDEIEYSDLLKDKFPLSPEGFDFGGGNALTYDAKSPSYSVKLKFRWTVGAANGIQFSFDRSGTGNSISYPFGVWVKNPNDNNAGANGAWHLKPTDAKLLVNMDTPATQGKRYDVEFGRLKIAESAAEHGGEYYVYLKVDGKLIQETYSSVDGSGNYTSAGTPCRISNEIMFDDWQSKGNKISSIPAPESYEDYAEIDYFDLLDNGARIADEVQLGTKTFTYANATETGSAIIKFRWNPKTDVEAQMAFDTPGDNKFLYMFGVQVYKPGADANYPNGYVWLRPGYGPKAQLPAAIETGKTYDIEFARLKIKTGENAGKYYMYFKMNDNFFIEDYVGADVVDSLGNYTSNPDSTACNISNKFFITNWGGGGGHKMTYIPEPETYDDYDEVYYENLRINGNSLPSEGIDLGSGRNCTYNATSDSYSAVLKFRWTAGAEARFVTYFDAWAGTAYPFCLAVKSPNYGGLGATAGENGAWHIDPSKGGQIVQMAQPIVAGTTHDMEFGRLKVLTGSNKGKYYVYLKVDGETVSSYYYAGVDANGNYNSGGVLNNTVYFNSSTSDNFISPIPIPETYEAYDELEYNDLRVSGNLLPSEMKPSGEVFTYNGNSPTYSAILKYRWKAVNNSSAYISFDTCGDSISYPFGAQLYSSDGTYPNGSVWIRLGYSQSTNRVALPFAIQTGNYYDVEFARLKVKTGANKGRYLVYIKIVDELNENNTYYAADYTEVNDVDANGSYISTHQSNMPCQLSYTVKMSAWSDNSQTRISAIPFEEAYDAYDEVTYSDLHINGNSLPSEGIDLGSGRNCTYNAKSPSYSAVLKFRWTAGAEARFVTYFDAWAATAYPFCLAVKSPNYGGLGATAGGTGAWHIDPSKGSRIVQMAQPIAAGSTHDMEFGRLKVSTGVNKGKYYVYLKVDGELVSSYYYDGVDENGNYNNGGVINNTVYFNSSTSDNIISEIPIPVEYEDYAEIEYSDLMDASGNKLPARGTTLSAATVLTYANPTATGSAVFKFCWKVGDVPKFQISFDKVNATTMDYMFGVQLEPKEGYPNGHLWLRPGIGEQKNLPTAILEGSTHDIEFARLKLKTGPNAGKYYVYIKIDDELISESYVDANTVSNNGKYTSQGTEVSLSNEIFFAFWGSNGNIIGPIEEEGAGDHTGIRGDFDNNGIIDANDLASLKKIIIGSQASTELADFNNDGTADILDLISLKKYLAPVNSYAKSGNLTFGLQEHLNQDETKTAEYIADVTGTMGAGAYRLSYSVNRLFEVSDTNTLSFNTADKNAVREMIDALTDKGITEILYVSDAFVTPYSYHLDPTKAHGNTVPNPVEEPELYALWLELNAKAFEMVAREFPELKYFEPFNEPNLVGTHLEKYGVAWNATDAVRANYKYTVKEKAGIFADLCWYASKAVKSVNKANQVTTPSISVDSTGNNANVEGSFLNELYKHIESGAYPRTETVADMRVDNYFTVVNLHSYPEYQSKEYKIAGAVDSFVSALTTAYNVMKSHNDGGSRVWLTETGVTDYGYGERDTATVAKLMKATLEAINTRTTFIDSVFIYEIANSSIDMGLSAAETNYGLFYCGDDADFAYEAKPIAKTVYSFFNNGASGDSVLAELANRYK